MAIPENLEILDNMCRFLMDPSVLATIDLVTKLCAESDYYENICSLIEAKSLISRSKVPAIQAVNVGLDLM